MSPASAQPPADAPWLDTSLSPDERADLLAAAMTLEQKVTLLSSGGSEAQAIPEVGIPARREIDGATGVITGGQPTTAFPAGSSIASTWNPALARAFGRQAGQEAYLLGWSGWAGPEADMVRNPFFGRQYGSYGEDPLLGGIMPAAVVNGVNQNSGVYSLSKHYVANTQETQRRTLNNVMDERTLREIYVRQWEPIVAAEPGAVMCAFPRFRGEYTCENEHLLQDILKGDLDFEGWVSSDFNACTSFEAFLAGADVCGPGEEFSGENLLNAVENGTIPMARFDDMIHRVLRTYFARGLIDNPPPGSLVNPRPVPDPLPDDVVQAGRDTSYRIAVDGSVLLRNQRRALPLNPRRLDSMALIGEGADRYITGFGSDIVINPTSVTTVLEGLQDRVGDDVDIDYVEGMDPVRIGDTLPGPQPVPSSVLQPAEGTGNGLTAQWFTNPDFAGTPNTTRVEDQVNWGQGLGGTFATFGYDPSPAPKLPDAFLGTPNPSVRWTGTINPVAGGTYPLGVTYLGEVTVFINGAEVFSGSTDTVTSETFDVDLEAGESYDVRIDYIANAPDQCCPASTNIGPAIRFTWDPPVNNASPQIQEAVEAARNSDVAVIVANDYLGESLDRGSLTLQQNQDDLIRAVTAANRNTIVVLTTGAPVLMPWLNRTAAVFESWYPGQEQGAAIAALLFGDENFSGRTPLSWPRSEEQVTQGPGVGEGLGIENPYFDVNKPNPEVVYREGVFIGYRGYQQFDLDPLFPFGYGLSYTNFRQTRLQIQDPVLAVSRGGNSTAETVTAEGDRGRDKCKDRGGKDRGRHKDKCKDRDKKCTWGEGAGHDRKNGMGWDKGAHRDKCKGRDGFVRVKVRNTGRVTGTEVVQVYNGRLPTDEVDTPPRQLLGWERVTLRPGQSRWVTIPIRLNTPEHRLAYWSEEQDRWVTPTGRVRIYVGENSEDVELRGTMTVRQARYVPGRGHGHGNGHGHWYGHQM
ncbi:glycoside hydrolase family 3 protein [Micromonosporaceae bacterium DT194]|uniref:beta-glucosidase n=1 Tax=Melissospora conviva TaxID=3388432 RepID=UPI003C26C584